MRPTDVPPAGLPAAHPVLRGALVAWYRVHRRDLPWRRTRDPYAIWVSEVMLQQTQVATVARYWEAFLGRFPSVTALAQAAPAEVLSAWSGLGYYRRARLMHQAAQVIRDQHGGVFPSQPDAVRALPGVGEYTAGAVLSLAFGQAVPAVDGNVTRVLVRLLGLETDPAARATLVAVRAAAAELVPGEAPGDVVQGLMELGATVCTPAAPDCPACPWRDACRAHARGDPERFPLPRRRAPRKPLHVGLALVVVAGRLRLVARGDQGLFGGLHEPPSSGEVPLVRGRAPSEARVRAALEQAQPELTIGKLLARTERTLSHRDLVLWTFAATPLRGPAAGGGVEVPLLDLGAAPLSTAVRVALQDALRAAGGTA